MLNIFYLETNFSMVLCDSPAEYVTRITHLNSIDLPEEVDDISNQLLLILKDVYPSKNNDGRKQCACQKRDCRRRKKKEKLKT
jgi:hypothetical protein